jgi:hypothetical protein
MERFVKHLHISVYRIITKCVTFQALAWVWRQIPDTLFRNWKEIFFGEAWTAQIRDFYSYDQATFGYQCKFYNPLWQGQKNILKETNIIETKVINKSYSTPENILFSFNTGSQESQLTVPKGGRSDKLVHVTTVPLSAYCTSWKSGVVISVMWPLLKPES